MFERIKEILVENLGIDEKDIHLDSHLQRDFLMDEIDLVDFLMELEDSFLIEIPDDTAATFDTVKDIILFLEAHA